MQQITLAKFIEYQKRFNRMLKFEDDTEIVDYFNEKNIPLDKIFLRPKEGAIGADVLNMLEYDVFDENGELIGDLLGSGLTTQNNKYILGYTMRLLEQNPQ